jgi:hypothetical protein
MRKWIFVLLVCAVATTGVAQVKKQTGKDKLKIEVLYFASCPASKDALANLKAVLREKI